MKIDVEIYCTMLKLIKSSNIFSEVLNRKIVSVGTIGEVECCFKMKWDIADYNNPGYDAIDHSGNKIQIKTFVENGLSQMVPAFNPSAPKNHEVGKIAVVVLNKDLSLNRILIATINDYKSKLKIVEERRNSKLRSGKRKERFDLSIDEFESIVHSENRII